MKKIAKVRKTVIKVCTRCGYYYYLTIDKCFECDGRRFKTYTEDQFKEVRYASHLVARSF